MNPSVEKAIKAAKKRDLETRYSFINQVCSEYITAEDKLETIKLFNVPTKIPIVSDDEYAQLKDLYPLTYAKIDDGYSTSEKYLSTIKKCVVFFTILTVIQLVVGIITIVSIS